MRYFLIIFLIIGFVISVMDIIKYNYFLRTINDFEKNVLDFKNLVTQENINMEEVNKLLTVLSEKYPFYSNSNIQFLFFPDYIRNQTTFLTSYWLFNASKFFQDIPGYHFKTFLEYIDNTLQECAASRGQNKLEVYNAYIGLIPIFYFHNCFKFITKQIPISNGIIPHKQKWWIKFIEIVSVLSGMVTIIQFFINFFFPKF